MPELGELSLKITAKTQGTADKILEVASAVDKLESSMSKVESKGASNVAESLALLNRSLFGVTSRAKGAEAIVDTLERLSQINMDGFGKSLGSVNKGVGVIDKAMDSIKSMEKHWGTNGKDLKTTKSLNGFVASLEGIGERAANINMNAFANISEGVSTFKKAADGISDIAKTFTGEKSDKAFEAIGAFGEGLIAVNDEFGGVNFAPMEAATDAVKNLISAKNAMKGLAEFGEESAGKQLSKGVTAFGSGMRRLGEWGTKINLDGAARFGEAAKAINPAKNALKGITEIFSEDNKAASSSAIRSFGYAMQSIGNLGNTINLEGVGKLKFAATSVNSARNALSNVQKLFADGGDLAVSYSTTSLGQILKDMSQDMSGLDVSGFKNLSTAGTGVKNIASGLRDITELYEEAGTEAVDSSIGGAVQSISNLGTQLMENITPEQIGAIGNVAKPMDQLTSSFNTLNDLSGADYSSSIQAIVASIQQLVAALRALDPSDVQRLRDVGTALQNLSAVSGVSSGISGLRSLAGSASSASRSIASTHSAATMMKNALSGIGRVGRSALSFIADRTVDMYKGFSLATLFSNKLLASLYRVAKMRALRALIKSVAEGVKLGLQSLSEYSSAAANTMNALSSQTSLLKANLAAALYPVISSCIGVFTSLTNAVINAMNAIGALFALLGGSSTYMRAVAAETKNFGTSADKSSGSAKALKQELMGFDEINSLSPDSGGGGGGGSGSDNGLGKITWTTEQISQNLKDMLASGDFTQLGVTIAEKINTALGNIDWDGMIAKSYKLAHGITTFLNGIIDTIDTKTIGNAIAGVINTAITFVATFWDETNWTTLGSKIATSINTALTGENGIDPEKLAHAVFGKLKSMFDFLGGFVATADWTGIGNAIGNFITSAVNYVNLPNATKTLSNLIIGALTAIDVALDEATMTKIANQIRDALVVAINAMPAIIGKVLNIAAKVANAIWESINGWFRENVAGKSFSELCSEAWGYLKSVFSNITVDLTGTLKMIEIAVGVFSAKNILSNLITSLGFGSGAFSLLGSTALLSFSVLFDLATDINSIADTTDIETRKKEIKAMLEGVFTAGIGGAIVLWGTGSIQAATIAFSILYHIQSEVDFGETPKTDPTLDPLGILGVPSKEEVSTQYFREMPEWYYSFPQPSEVLKMPEFTAYDTFFSEYWGGIDTSNFDGITDVFNDLNDLTLTTEQLKTALDTLGFDSSDPLTYAASLEALSFIMNKDDDAAEKFKQMLVALGLVVDENFPVEATVTVETEGVTETEEGIETVSTDVDDLDGSTAKVTVDIPDSVTFSIDATDVDTFISDAPKASAAARVMSTQILSASALIKSVGTTEDLAGIRNTTTALGLASLAASATALALNLIPSSKSSKISVSASKRSMEVLDDVKSSITGLSSKTVTLTIKAVLASGVKTTLTALKPLLGATQQQYVGNLLNVATYANGGFMKGADLYVANESGAELVGRIGSQPAVANQQQIGDAIFQYMDKYGQQKGGNISAEAIASAVVSGCKAAGLGAVYLDGKMLAGSINRESRRSGRPAINF